MTQPPDRGARGTSRREFLTQTASLAGAGALLSTHDMIGATSGPIPAARRRAHPRPDEPVRIGVIGTGGMGTGHCQAITKLAEQGKENVQIVALCDVCEPRLEHAADKVEKAQKSRPDVYTAHEDLMARDDLHGVLIAAPEHWHAQLAEDAIAAGLDVYVEKPMTLRLEQALRLYHVSNANRHVIVQVGTQFIAQEKYQHARRLLREGGIGKATSSQTSYCRNSKDGEWLYYGIDPKWEPGVNLDWDRWCGPMGKQPWDPAVYARWRRYRKFSTGIIGDLLVHVMTPMIYAIEQGWPTRVVACGGHYVDKAMENHDQVDLTVQFEGQHTLTVSGSTCNEKGIETMIRGHEATLYLGGKDCVLRPERHWVEEIDEQKIICKSLPDQDMIRLDWLSCIRSREANLSPVELGMKVMVIVDLATRSMWEGKAFEFDPNSLIARAV